MTAEFSQQVRNDYVVAQFAYWAGDYLYAQQRYARAAGRTPTALNERRPSPRERDDSAIEQLRDADALLEFVADGRERRIADRRQTFDTLVLTLAADGPDLVSQPLVLETERLRGAVWRLNAREFEMRAYVTDIKHAKPVLKRAKEIAEEHTTAQRQPVPHVETPQELVYSTQAYEWEEPGNPLVSILVTRLMFIEVGRFWTDRVLPVTFAPIQERLQSVLDSLSNQRHRQ